jgi:hypothetical protein
MTLSGVFAEDYSSLRFTFEGLHALSLQQVDNVSSLFRIQTYCEVCHLSPIWGEGGRFLFCIFTCVSENTIVDIHFCIVIRNIVSFEFRMN